MADPTFQSGAPFQQQPGVLLPPPPKRGLNARDKGCMLFLGLGCLGLAVILILAFWSMMFVAEVATRPATNAGVNFVTLVSEGKLAQAHALMAPSVREEHNSDELKAELEAIGLSGFHSFVQRGTRKVANTATFEFETKGGEAAGLYYLELVEIGEMWYVSDFKKGRPEEG